MDRYSRKFAILKSYTPILSEILATMELSSEARPEFEWQLYTLLVSLENNRKIFTYEELLSCEIFFNEIRAHGPLELRYHMEQIDRRRYLNEPANQNITRFHPYMSNLINNLPSRNIYMTEKSQTKGNTSSHLSTTTSLRHTQDTNSTNTEPAGTPAATENDHLIDNHPLGNSETSTTSSVYAETLQLCESYSEREIVCIEDNANKSNQSSSKPTNDSIIISMQASDETTISLNNKSTNEVQAAADSECMNNIPSPVIETTPLHIKNVSIDSNDSKSISITELNNELSAKTIITVAEFCEISDTASSTNQMEVDIVVENEPTVEENTIVNEELVEDSISLGSITTVTSDSNTDEIDFDANNFSCPQQINTELSSRKIETNNVKSNYKILDVVEMIVDSEYMDVNHIVSRSVSSEMVVSSDENESHTITEFQNQSSIEPCIAEDEVNTIEIAATVSSQQITGMLDNETNSNYNTGTLLIDEPSKIQDDEIVDENVIKISDGNLEEKFGESDIELSQVSLQNYPGYYYQHEYSLSSTNCNESDQDYIYHPILPGFTSGFNKFDDKYFITMITSDKPVTDTAKDSNIVRLKYHFREGLKFEIENKDESDYILYTITNGEKQKFTGRFSELKLHLLDLCKNSENYDEPFYIFVFLALMNVDNGSIDNYLRCNQYPEKISSEVEEKDTSRIYNINKILNAFNPEQIILINTQNENQNDEENIFNDFAISELNDFEEIISPIYEHINVQKANYDKKVLELPAITVTTIDLNERDNENVADSTPINCITDSVIQTNAKNETEKCIMNVDENSVNTNRASGELNKNQAPICCNPKNEKCILNSNSLQSAIEIDESPKIKPVNVRKRKSKSRAVRKLPQTSSIKTDMYDKISSDQMSQTTDREIQNTNAPVMPDCNVETATDTEHQETIGKNVIQTRSKTMTKKSTSKNLKDESSDSLKRNIKMILRKPKKPLNEKTLAVVTEGCLPGKLLLNATDTVCDAVGDNKIENLQTILPSNNTNPVYSNSSNAYDEIGRTTCTEEIRNLNRIKYQKKTKNGKSTIRVPSNDNLHVGSLGDEEYFAGDNDDRKLNSKSASVGNKDKKVPAKKIMEFATVDNSEADNGTALQEIAKQKCLNNVVKSTMPATNQRTESTTSQITSSIEIVEMNINNRNLVEGIQSSKNSSSKEICIKFTLPSNNASENMNQAAVANFANERDLDDPCNSEITGIESVRTDFYVDTKGDKTRTDPVADKECEREKIFLANTSDALVNSTETAEDIIEHHSVSQFEIESFKKGDSGISLTASDVFEESMETIENPGIITSHYTGKSNDVRTQRLSCDTNAMFIEPLIPIDRIKVEETYDCDRNFNSDLVDSVENEESSDILSTSNHFIRTTGTYHVTQNDGIPVTSGHGASTSQAVLNEELKIEERQRSDIESDKEMVEPSKNGIADAPLRLSDDPNTASATKDRIILFGKFIESNTSLNRNSRMKLRRNSISVNEVINLTPWLKTKVFKKKVNAIHMLMKVKLQHLFKCVDPECSFTTNRSSEMVQHLDYHDTTTDSRLFRKCAYCSVSTPNTSYLVSHITDEHGESRYQCLYCFYRSCAHVNVINHQKNLHQGLPLSVLICAGSEPDGLRIREDIERNRKKFVLPFVCSECQISFFLWDQYYEHLKTMHAENGEICNVCERKFSIDMMQQHYLTHNMGMFQCLHCFFSSNLRNNIERHMSSQHASKIPFTLVRIMSPHYKHKNQCPTNIQDQCSPIEAAYIIILETKAEENRRELCPDLLAMYESEVISISSDSDE